jgi:hypothetical protein
MSICRSKTYKDNDKYLKEPSNSKLRKTKTIDSNKVAGSNSNKNPFESKKQGTTKDFLRPSNTMKEQSKKFIDFFNKKIFEKYDENKTKKQLENHERSTFFDGKEEIRESDIVFDIEDKKPKDEIEKN